jgi:uncharacterized protein
MTFKIICCDGGGIRGLMTALLLQDLDKQFGVVAKADGFAGTSTGGLIALGLANNIPINDIVSIYETEGSTIFEPNGWMPEEKKKECLAPQSIEEFVTGPGVLSCQYTNAGLISIAKGLFGSKSLSEAKKYVAINTARLWNGSSWEPATFSNAAGNAYADVMMRDAALATSAAPTYFPPYQIDNLGYFADGGTYANNPSMSAIADALKGGRADALGNVLALSLGTGLVPQGIVSSSISHPLNWGVTHWMWPYAFDKVPPTALINLMMDCTSQAVTVEAQNLLLGNFCRGNVPMPKAIGLDEWKQVGTLKQYATAYMNSAQWQQVRTWVGAVWR